MDKYFWPFIISLFAAIIYAIISSLLSINARKRIGLILNDIRDVEAQLVNFNLQCDYSATMNCVDRIEDDVLKIFEQLRPFTFFWNIRKKRLFNLYLCNLLVFVTIVKNTWLAKPKPNPTPEDKEKEEKDLCTVIASYLGVKYKDYSLNRWIVYNILILKLLNERIRVKKCFNALMKDARMEDYEMVNYLGLPKDIDTPNFQKDKFCWVIMHMVSPLACNVSSYSHKTMSKFRYDKIISGYYGLILKNPHHDFLKKEDQWYEEIFNESDLQKIAECLKYKRDEVEKEYLRRDMNVEIRYCFYDKTWVKMIYYPHGKIYKCNVEYYFSN